MLPEDHRKRAERIELSLAKCKSLDYEMKIEAAMLAGTHWLNLLLHEMGVMPSHVDIMHTYMLTVNDIRKYSVADESAVKALAEIEDIRPGYVRGNLPKGEEAAARAIELLECLRNRAEQYRRK